MDETLLYYIFHVNLNLFKYELRKFDRFFIKICLEDWIYVDLQAVAGLNYKLHLLF